MKHKWRLVVGVLVFVLMSVNWAVIHFTDERRPGSYDGWTARLSPESGAVIVNVDPTGPASALQIGDELWRVDGVPVNDANPAVLNFNRTVPPGTRYPVQLRRNGQLIELTLQTVPYAQRAWSFSRVWIVLVYLLFLLTGAFIFLLRSDDRQAWLLALLLWTMTGLTGNNIVSGLPGWIFFTLLLARTVALWFMPLSLHFFLIFPQPVPWLRRFAQWERWLYAPFYLILLPSFGLGQLPAGLLGPTLAALFRSERFMDLDLGLVVAYLVGGLLALVSNYRAAERMARQRLRVILVGSGLGVLNLLLMPLGEWMGWQTRFPQLWAWLATALLFTLPLVPLSFAYAIIRHKVIPISLLLRRGVRYLLVSRGSTVMVMVGLSFVMFFVMDTFFRYLRPTSGRVIGVISAITAIVFWRLTNAFHQRIVAPVIDRHFFRQAYDSQQILTELAESLRTTTDIPTLLESVADKLQSALQTASVAIFLRDEKTGAYHNTYACEYNATSGRAAKCEIGNEQGGRLPQCAATLAQLAETGNTLELDGSEPAFDLANTGVTSQLTAEERQTLFDAKAALLLPLKTKNDMPGVIALGARLGDLPFSGDDKRLLQSVAASAALALENAQLVERMLADARRHQEIEAENEQRAKELEEARQLQLSMLPRSIPQLPNLEIAAFMQTATEVGGDYYDFHLSSDGTLTIAIGDATGHGLKAGTVVTATKSLFKHLAQQSDVVTTMHDASRALKQMNLRSLFMALTLVKVKGERLHCSVAGMPPILIYRAATRDIEELALRGAPLGGMTHYNYRAAEITLAANDVLLLMSDGLTERFNPDDEMFDYERTKAAFIQLAHATPHAIAEGLLHASEAWAQGRPLDDDLTLVVLKRKPDA